MKWFIVSSKILIILSCLTISCLYGQKVNERQAIDKSHLDFTKQYLYFVINDTIEIDGHTYWNPASRSPIIFQATIDGITIIDTLSKQTYVRRKCSLFPNCGIIHLEKVVPNTIRVPNNWYNSIPTNPLYLNGSNAITPVLK